MNETTTFNYYDFWRLSTKDYINLCFCIPMGVTGIILNTLTILIIGFGANISKEVKIQLINMAVADLLMATFDAILELSLFTLLTFPNSQSLCIFYRLLQQAAHCGSLLCSAAISLERLFIVFFPLRVSHYTKCRKYLVVAAIWTIVLLLGIRNAVKAQLFEIAGKHLCVEIDSFEEIVDSVDHWMTTLPYILEALVISTAYILIAVKLHSSCSGGPRSHMSNQRRRDINKVLFVCVLLAK